MPARVTPAWVDHGSCTGARISLRYKISELYHVNAKRPPVSVWSRSAGRLERVAHAQCLRFWITRVFYQHEVHFQITRYEPSHHVNAFRNQKVIPVWNSRRCEFSEHPLILNILFVIDSGVTSFFFLFFIMKRHLEEIFFFFGGGENVTMQTTSWWYEHLWALLFTAKRLITG